MKHDEIRIIDRELIKNSHLYAGKMPEQIATLLIQATGIPNISNWHARECCKAAGIKYKGQHTGKVDQQKANAAAIEKLQVAMLGVADICHALNDPLSTTDRVRELIDDVRKLLDN